MPTVCGAALSAISYFLSITSPTIFLIAMMSRHHFGSITSCSCYLQLAEDDFVVLTSSSPSLTLNSLCGDSSFLSLAFILSNDASCHLQFEASPSVSCWALHVQRAHIPQAASTTGSSAILPTQTLALGISSCVNGINIFSASHHEITNSVSSLPGVFVTLFSTVTAETQLSWHSSQPHCPLGSSSDFHIEFIDTHAFRCYGVLWWSSQMKSTVPGLLSCSVDRTVPQLLIPNHVWCLGSSQSVS